MFNSGSYLDNLLSMPGLVMTQVIFHMVFHRDDLLGSSHGSSGYVTIALEHGSWK